MTRLPRSSRLGQRLCVLLALVLAGTLACRREQRQEEEQPASGPAAEKGGPAARSGAPQTVVALTGSDFQMTGTLPPGPVRFLLKNASANRHSFAVEGGGARFRLESPVPPGESAVLDADLPAGSYRVFCPMSGHTELPRLLVVTPRAARP